MDFKSGRDFEQDPFGDSVGHMMRVASVALSGTKDQMLDKMSRLDGILKQLCDMIGKWHALGEAGLSPEELALQRMRIVAAHDQLVSSAESRIKSPEDCGVQQSVVFGILISSRNGRCEEMIAMMEFCQAAKNANVNSFVKSLSFDSPTAVCTIEFQPDVPPADLETVQGIARGHLPNFVIGADPPVEGEAHG